MRMRIVAFGALILGLGVAALVLAGPPALADHRRRVPVPDHARLLIEEGRQTFRFDTFGSEGFFGDAIQLHQAIEGARFGGVGPGVSPRAALAVGLKVDEDALPGALKSDLRRGRVDLDDPAVTLELLRLNAVVGVTGHFNDPGDATKGLRSVGIQCAFCHSTVDDSFAPGIGKRLDGWANQDLNVGAILALAPNLQPVADLLSLAGTPVDVATLRAVLNGWGPGRFDAEVFLDGKARRPDGGNASTLIPDAFGLAGHNNHTWTGAWGTVTYWNAFVANLEMHGQPGTFYDPRLDDAAQFPVAARARLGHLRAEPGRDRITPKLAALHVYQLVLPAPRPPEGSFDAAAAGRGLALFNGPAQCATCHVPPLYTEPGWNLHKPEEIGIDSFQADRAPDRRYRTAALAGRLWKRTRGFYHDGRFATLRVVVDHYNNHRRLNLTEQQKSDLVEYLKSL